MAAPALALLLAGCGIPIDSGVTPHRQVAVRTTSVDVNGFIDQYGASVEIPIYRSGADVVLCPVPAQAPVVSAYARWDGSATEGSLEINLTSPGEAGLGTFRSTLQLRACNARFEGVAPEGETVTVDVRYYVYPALLVTTPAFPIIQQVIGAPAAPPLEIQVTGTAMGGAWTVEPEFYMGTPWFEVSPRSGSNLPATITVTPTMAYRAGLAPYGQYLRFRRAGTIVDLWIGVNLVSPPLPDVLHAVREVTIRTYRGQASLPPPVNVALTTSDGSTRQWTPGCSYAAEPWWDTWLGQVCDPAFLARAPGTLSVDVKRTDIPPGAHVATIGIPGADGNLKVTLEVVAPTLSVVEHPAIVAIDATTPSAQGVLHLASSGGPVPFSIQAGSSWLTVSPAAGVVPDGGTAEVVLAVAPEAVEALPWGYYDVALAIQTTEPDGTPVVVPGMVQFRNGLPTIYAVGPRSDPLGSTRPVSLLTSGGGYAAGVTFGGVPASSTAVFDGVLVRVTPPPLPVGVHRVRVVTASGLTLGETDYEVFEPGARAAAVIPSPGRKVRLQYDDPRQALYAVNVDAGTLERFDAANGWASIVADVAGLDDAALTPDGGRFLVVVPGSQASFREASTLAPMASTLTGQTVPAVPGWRVAMYASGDALLVPPYLPPGHYQSLAFRSRSSQFELDWQALVDGATIGASRAGDLAALVTPSASPPAIYLGAYNTMQPLPGQPKVPAPFLPTAVALDRHGDRILLLKDGTAGGGDSALLDAALNVLPGRLPDATAAAMLTQDGDQAIAFDGALRTVRRFDLTAAPDLVTGEFPELGPPGGLDPGGEPGAGVVLALSADDRTRFVAGDQAVVVFPLP